MNFFISELWNDPYYFFAQLLLVVFSICLHEYCHARVALSEGDPTAAELGHLTLNPLRQMGIASVIMLLLIGIAWGAVPVNPANFRRRSSDLRISLAGPAANLGLFLIFSLLGLGGFCLLAAGNESPALAAALFFFQLGAVLNIVLFVFNMLPVPGFDGWALVRSRLAPERFARSEMLKGASLLVLLLALIFSRYFFLAGNWLFRALVFGGVALFQSFGWLGGA